MIQFDTQEQKAFVLEAITKVTIPALAAARVAPILQALEDAKVAQEKK